MKKTFISLLQNHAILAWLNYLKTSNWRIIGFSKVTWKFLFQGRSTISQHRISMILIPQRRNDENRSKSVFELPQRYFSPFKLTERIIPIKFFFRNVVSERGKAFFPWNLTNRHNTFIFQGWRDFLDGIIYFFWSHFFSFFQRLILDDKFLGGRTCEFLDKIDDVTIV